MKFNEFNLKPELIHTLDDMGFEEPTPIQQQAIPHALEGRDVIGQAQTVLVKQLHLVFQC